MSSTVEKNGSSEHSAGSMKYMCVICGKRLDQVEKCNSKTRELVLGHKKLHLVLDLDHTLLHTTSIGSTKWKRYLLEGDQSLEDVFLIRKVCSVTKLRPFVRKFLKEAAEMFELSVYTMGDRLYAQEMVKLLDPKNEYFGDRVVSRDDSTKESEKNLDVVCAKESAVLVLDDTQKVWAERNQDQCDTNEEVCIF